MGTKSPDSPRLACKLVEKVFFDAKKVFFDWLKSFFLIFEESFFLQKKSFFDGFPGSVLAR